MIACGDLTVAARNGRSRCFATALEAGAAGVAAEGRAPRSQHRVQVERVNAPIGHIARLRRSCAHLERSGSRRSQLPPARHEMYEWLQRHGQFTIFAEEHRTLPGAYTNPYAACVLKRE